MYCIRIRLILLLSFVFYTSEGKSGEDPQSWMTEIQKLLGEKLADETDPAQPTETDDQSRFLRILKSYDKLGLDHVTTTSTYAPVYSDDILREILEDLENELPEEDYPDGRESNLAEDEVILEQELDFVKDKTEVDKQTFEVLGENGEPEEAILEENATILTNDFENMTVVLLHDELKILNASTNETIYETESDNEVSFQGQFDEKLECGPRNPCKMGYFCPASLGILSECVKCKKEGAQCLKNEECCDKEQVEGKGSVCFFGRCSLRAGLGERGVNCDSNFNCNRGHCCRYMEEFSSNFCDVLPTLGEVCLEQEVNLGTGLAQIFMQGCSACHPDFVCSPNTNRCVDKSWK